MEERMKELDTSNVEDFPVANFFKLTLFPLLLAKRGAWMYMNLLTIFGEVDFLFRVCVCVCVCVQQKGRV